MLLKIWNVIRILAVFALAGSSTAFFSGLIMSALGAKPWTWGYVIGYILFIFPLYQILTIIYAFILGKFRFFYDRQKKIFLFVAGLPVKLFTKLKLLILKTE